MSNFKEFLCMKRKPDIIKNTTLTENQRYSLDITEELRNTIEQRMNAKIVQRNVSENTANIQNEKYTQGKPNISKSVQNSKENINHFYDIGYGETPLRQKTSDKNIEALDQMCGKSLLRSGNTPFNEREGKSSEAILWQNMSDESFEAIEKMCDKTASDPNSTLFQYLHSDRKEQVLAEVKKRSADGMPFKAQNLEDNLLMKLNNCSLLEDVEAPSRIWENTICGDTVLQTSPVKMIGLLRPSTILEEAPNDSSNSDVSTQSSFNTAGKSGQSDASSSAYDTASDFTAATNRTDFPNKSRPEDVGVINVDDILLTALKNNKEVQGTDAAIIPTLDTMDTTIVKAVSSNNMSEDDNSPDSTDMSLNLIDLEKTLGTLCSNTQSIINESGHKKQENNEKVIQFESKVDSYNISDDSVIEILSDDEDEGNEIENAQNINNRSCLQQNLSKAIKAERNSTGKNSFDINHDIVFNESNKSDKENCEEFHETSEKSMQFNDTMEEVEYMLKMGMEYMAAEAAVEENPKHAFGKQVSKNVPASPLKPVNHITSSSSKAKAFIHKTPAKITPMSKGQSSTLKSFNTDIRPFPKLDIFSNLPAHARKKELISKQNKFAHIVSPIGTYMKKTSKTPLMSSINVNNKGYFNSTAIRELENESRWYQQQFKTNSNGKEDMELPGLKSGYNRPLPKKAYISSDLKHIVDERTHITIPGGQKIQKYLENAMIPAVLRHEGKLKIQSEINNKANISALSKLTTPKFALNASDVNLRVPQSTSEDPRRDNASLADLSVMSGDVSMYTIMDAQKF